MKRGHLLVFLYGVSTLLFSQFFVRYLLNSGFNPNNLGFLMAGAFAVDFIVSVPTGVAADTFGVKRICIIGFALLGIASLFGSFASNWMFLALGYVFYKIGDATVSGVISVWSKNIPDTKKRGSAGLIFTRLDQMQRIGMITMALLTGLMIRKTGFSDSLPWIISFFITLCMIMVGLKTKCTSEFQAKAKSITEVVTKLKSFLKENSNLRLALFGVLILGIADGLMSSKYWVWVIEDLKFDSPLAIALIIALLSLSRAGGLEFFSRCIKVERARLMTALLGITAITFVFASKMPPGVLLTLWFVRVFVYSSYFPLLNKEVESFSHPDTVNAALSAVPMITAIGSAIGALACSGLKMESQSTFISMAILSGVAAFLWANAFNFFSKPTEAIS